MATIIGNVDKNGNIVTGTGFTVNNSASGIYKISFTIPFTSPPVVVASLTSGSLDSDQNNNVLMVDPGASAMTVFITDTNQSDGQNGGFTFIASNG